MLKFFYKSMNNKKGFTLIELIVVIAILGILAAIAVPRLGGFRDKAEEAAKEATIRTLEGAYATYLAEVGEDDAEDWDEDNDDVWGSYLNTWPSVDEEPVASVGLDADDVIVVTLEEAAE